MKLRQPRTRIRCSRGMRAVLARYAIRTDRGHQHPHKQGRTDKKQREVDWTERLWIGPADVGEMISGMQHVLDKRT